MKSGELARLAGVTVRTLRHYRDIGLLPEPARTDNGYCDYTGDDYFRLLRIKNLSSLGFSLAEIKTFLDHPETAPDSNLDALDARLAENIEKLNAQRRTIALLKASQASVDMPPLFADFLALLSHQNLPDDILQMEINSFLSVADNLNEDALQEIVAFYQSLTQKNLLSQYIRLCCAMTAWTGQPKKHWQRIYPRSLRRFSAPFGSVVTVVFLKMTPTFWDCRQKMPPFCKRFTTVRWKFWHNSPLTRT